MNTEELDLAATSDVYWQHTLDDDASLNDPNVDDNQLAKYLAVVVDSTGKPVEMRSNNDQFSCDTRNLKSAQKQFPLVTQPEMICQTGGSVQARIAEERENAQAQIRTMLDEQRRTIIAECNEKVPSSRTPLFITNSSQLMPNKIAKFFKKNYCDNNRTFVKFINKIL